MHAIEKKVTREKMDAFLKSYLMKYGHESITTEQFLSYLSRYCRSEFPKLLREVQAQQWVYEAVVPEYPTIDPELFGEIDRGMIQWLKEEVDLDALHPETWNTFEWQHFLINLPANLSDPQMQHIGLRLELTKKDQNAIVVTEWLKHVIAHSYHDDYNLLEEFLIKTGRGKFLKPLYKALFNSTPENFEFGERVFSKAKAGYHNIMVGGINKMMAAAKAPKEKK